MSAFTVSFEPVQGYDAALKDARTHLDATLKSGIELLSIPARKDDIEAARKVADGWCGQTSDVVVLGIGGSSLGGQALKTALEAHDRKGPRVTFHDNPDPYSWEHHLEKFDLKTTRFVVISKSGGTAETLMQAVTAADRIEQLGGGQYLKHHFAVVTEPKDSPLLKFAHALGCPVLDHPTGIGGRYSVLSMVGVLPALLMGIDVEGLRAGAAETLAGPQRSAEGAALHFALAQAGRLNDTVLWVYADRLATLEGWWRQLWAESLGKNGKGSTPVGALGPVDQHSQLQLFRDGPGKSLYTILTTEMKGRGPSAPSERAAQLGIDYLAGKTMGDLVDAEARATGETLARNGRPVRRIHMPGVDARSVGALMMHFMLETIVMGRLMGVDPFDQPGVEEGKVLAREYLKS